MGDGCWRGKGREGLKAGGREGGTEGKSYITLKATEGGLVREEWRKNVQERQDIRGNQNSKITLKERKERRRGGENRRVKKRRLRGVTLF